MDGGPYTLEERSWSDKPHPHPCAVDGRQDMMAVFTPWGGGGGKIASYSGIYVSWLISYQENHQKGTPLIGSLIRTIIN